MSPNLAEYWIHSKHLLRPIPESTIWLIKVKGHLSVVCSPPIFILRCRRKASSDPGTVLRSNSGLLSQLPETPTDRLAKPLSSPADGGLHHTVPCYPCQTLLKHIITARAVGYLHSAIDVSMTDSAAASITLQKCSIIQSQ